MDKSIQEKIYKYFEKYETETYSKGKILTFANQDPKGISLLIDGLVEQYDTTSEGNKITVNVFRPPSFFPMSWAINNTPNNYFYSALTDIEIKVADPKEVIDFLKSDPEVMFDLLSRVYKGTDALLKRLVLAASGMAVNRLILELLIEAYRFGVQSDDGMVLVKIKHNVLAAHSGLARETVTREFNKLEADSLIYRTKDGILLDTNKLEAKLSFNN